MLALTAGTDDEDTGEVEGVVALTTTTEDEGRGDEVIEFPPVARLVVAFRRELLDSVKLLLSTVELLLLVLSAAAVIGAECVWVAM